jgi:hypothetical protein
MREKHLKNIKKYDQCYTGILFNLRKSIGPGENTMIGFLIIGTRQIIGH